MLFELREYHTRPGCRDAWVRLMEETIVPFQIAQGMVIIGSFVGEADDNTYIWIRRFENEEERARLYKAVYESDFWKNTIAPQVPEMLDRSRTVITRLTPTPKSVIR